MIKVTFVFRTARIKQYQDSIIGRIPNHVLYGANHLEKMGYDIVISDDAYSPTNFWRLLLLPLENILIKITSIGFKLDQAIILLGKLRSSNVIITTTDSCGLPILLFKSFKLISAPIIYISTGLINELSVRKKSWISKIYFKMLKRAEVIICHSPSEQGLFLELVRRDIGSTFFIPFGIDDQYFNSSNSPSEYILSIGRDRSRDYACLSSVAALLPSEKFTLITSRGNVQGLKFPPNVTTYYDLSYDQVKEYYQKAKLVFLPLKELNRAAGQISFLESIASSCKVVISSVKGLTSVYPDIISENKNVYLLKNNSTQETADTIRECLNKKNAKYLFPQAYTSLKYAEHLDVIIKGIWAEK